MPAKTVVFFNKKGGPGKTTLSMNVAATLALDARVLVIDADPQASATKWFNAAPESRPFPVPVVGYSQGKVNLTVQKFAPSHDFIVVDTPPSALAENMITRSALLVADLAVIPVVPSPLDLWQALEVKTLLLDVNTMRESVDLPPLPARLVLNRLQAGTVLGRDVQEVLAEFDIPLFETMVHQRQIYARSVVDGCSVHQAGRDAAPACEEMRSLTAEIVEALHGEKKRRRS